MGFIYSDCGELKNWLGEVLDCCSFSSHGAARSPWEGNLGAGMARSIWGQQELPGQSRNHSTSSKYLLCLSKILVFGMVVLVQLSTQLSWSFPQLWLFLIPFSQAAFESSLHQQKVIKTSSHLHGVYDVFGIFLSTIKSATQKKKRKISLRKRMFWRSPGGSTKCNTQE